MTDEDERMRADARANRDRILDVAREALAADPQTSLNSIAKAAGIGPGTLYRHFQNREALVVGVYKKEIDDQIALVPKLLAEQRPSEAFRMWCDRLLEFAKVKHGVADLLHAAMSEQDRHEIYGPLIEAVGKLIDACEHAGEIRPGADPEDVLMLVGLLWRVPPTPAGEARVKRLLTLIFRGLGIEDATA